MKINLFLFLCNEGYLIVVNEKDEKNIKETKEAIKKAQENLEKISKDEHERYLAELREKYIRDQVAVQEYGYIHGKEEGREEGREEGKTELIKTMVKNGVSISQIADMLKIKVSEIEEMLK